MRTLGLMMATLLLPATVAANEEVTYEQKMELWNTAARVDYLAKETERLLVRMGKKVKHLDGKRQALRILFQTKLFPAIDSMSRLHVSMKPSVELRDLVSKQLGEVSVALKELNVRDVFKQAAKLGITRRPSPHGSPKVKKVAAMLEQAGLPDDARALRELARRSLRRGNLMAPPAAHRGFAGVTLIDDGMTRPGWTRLSILNHAPLMRDNSWVISPNKQIIIDNGFSVRNIRPLGDRQSIDRQRGSKPKYVLHDNGKQTNLSRPKGWMLYTKAGIKARIAAFKSR